MVYSFSILICLNYVSLKCLSIFPSLTPIDDDGNEVEGERKRYEAWRRYSEFDFLKNFLFAAYPHVSSPLHNLLVHYCLLIIYLHVNHV